MHPPFNSNTTRVVDIDGEPWFVVSDVCVALEYYLTSKGRPNVTVACRPLGSDEVGMYRIQTPSPNHPDLYTNMKIIAESGLYKMIMRSDKPEARTFQDWVTKVVLPAIRKDGGYIMGVVTTRQQHQRKIP